MNARGFVFSGKNISNFRGERNDDQVQLPSGFKAHNAENNLRCSPVFDDCPPAEVDLRLPSRILETG